MASEFSYGMMETLHFNQLDLPEAFENVIIYKDDEFCDIRSSIKNLNHIDKWISEFSRKTETSWIVRSSRPHKTAKLLCRKEYVCLHSSFKKKKPEGCKKQKHYQCPASINVIVKLTTATTAEIVKDGLPAKISVKLKHSHHLRTAAALGNLKPQKDMRETFENYFQNGLSVAEAIRFHEATFEQNSDYEVNIANARNMPKYRTVSHWHDKWRKHNFGTRTGDDIFKVIAYKQAIYEEKGTKIVFEKDPLAIVIVTPMMQRAHMLPLAKDIVFADSTASCNVENHCITFLLTACAIGAVPLGVIITTGQTMNNYKAGFELLQKTVNEPFSGYGIPVNFMTDDSDAEREAIKAVWKQSNRFLCHFHVSQAVWRWLRKKENNIDEKDRQLLYKSFKCIMVAVTKEDAASNYEKAVSTASKYPNWINYTKNYWKRNHEWALAWRNVFLHDNNTNNYCEASVRLFKDMILCSNKAYNVVALIDYTSILLEDYYMKRLRNFAHSRCDKPRLAFNHKLSKAAYLQKSDIKPDYEKNVFSVPSESCVGKFYTVDPKDGSCTCSSGGFGGFCKHQAAVFLHYDAYSPSMPGVSTAARYEKAILAFGKNAKAVEFYQPLGILTETVPLSSNFKNYNSVGENSENENQVDDKCEHVNEFLEVMY